MVGLDGVSQIRDEREVVEPIYDDLDVLRSRRLGRRPSSWWSRPCCWSRNTIRLAAFARRREIAIMRLVGASTLYIALPFLLEALVTAVIGVALAVGALGALDGVRRGEADRRDDLVHALDRAGRLLLAVVVIAILGPLLTLIPTLLLTRKYLKV